MEKIAILLNELQGGGAERNMIHLANHWTSTGLPVDLVVGRFRGHLCSLVNPDVKVVRLDTRLKRMLPRLIRYLNKEKPDILLSTLQSANILAAVAGTLSRAHTKVILREANSPGQKAKHVTDWQLKLVYRYLSRLTYPLANGYISVSQELKREMTRYYRIPGRKIRAIYNPVIHTGQFETGLGRSPAGSGRDGICTILGMGRVVPQKDFATLLRAFSIVWKKRAQSHLVILGDTDIDPSCYRRLQHLARELGIKRRVSFAGFQQNPEEYLAKADVFVLSSRYEGLPGSLIQAMFMGCRLVSTDCPHGPAEILDHGRFGTLVPVGDPEAMAQAIESSLMTHVDMDEVTEKCRDFAVDQVADQYLEYFQTFL